MKKTKKKIPRKATARRVGNFQGHRVVQTIWKGKRVDTLQGQFVYRTKSKAPMTDAAMENAFAEEVAAATTDRLGIGIVSMIAMPGAEMAAAVKPPAKLPKDILWMEPIMLDYGCATPNDPFFFRQWGLKAIQAERAWDLWTGDPKSVILAILDTGVPREAGKLSHPDLDDGNRILIERDTVNKDMDPDDDHGHGTHVLGIAAAATNNNTGVCGLWPGLVLIIKVFNNNMAGTNDTFKDGILAALDFAAAHSARLVINYSGGGPDNDTKKAAVQAALDEGALLVGAAGNDYSKPILFPAAYSQQFENVIAVGAVDSNKKKADFSNRGDEMSLVAPGVGIFSTMPNYEVTETSLGHSTKYDSLDGTSMATPFVSALAALVWSKWPNLSAKQVRDKLIASADPLPGSPKDYGNGIINAERALQ